MRDLKKKFDVAAADSKNLSEATGNDVKLNLYGLFKQAVAGDMTGSRPGFMDVAGRAKYDAWAALRGTRTEDAMQQYIDLIESLKPGRTTMTNDPVKLVNRAKTTVGTAYLMVAVVFIAFVAVLVAVIRITPASAHAAQNAALIQPVTALVALTAIVTLLMVVYRNVAVIRGAASERYFRSFTADKPAEWVERPTRTYMNLLELPVLFYVVCLFMLATGKFDAIQVSLAWVFVVTRYVHAFIYIGFNYVPLRFTAFLSGVLTLFVMWARFAEQNLN